MNVSGRFVSRIFSHRHYSTQVAAKPSAVEISLTKQDVRVTRMPNGVLVASLENNSPVTKLAVIQNGGSRYEAPDEAGITHYLRTLCGQSGSVDNSSFSFVRNIQQKGGSFNCTTTRENSINTLTCTRNMIDELLPFLTSASFTPVFKPWEVTRISPHLTLDLAFLKEQPNTQLCETIHKAAFRDGLGRSLYIPEHNIGSFNHQQLASFVSRVVDPNQTVFAGVGIDHEHLAHYVANLEFSTGSAKLTKTPAKYWGGEIRIETSNPLVHAAVVTEGTSLGSKDLLATCLLQYLMGVGPSVKYSENIATSQIHAAAARGTNAPFAASSININYSDSGLFGFSVIGHHADMQKILPSVVAQFSGLTKSTIEEKDLNRAKAQLKSSLSMSQENSDTLLSDIGAQASLSGKVISVSDLQAAIDNVSTTDVQNVAKKVINGKPSLAAIGNLGSTPYLDQIL